MAQRDTGLRIRPDTAVIGTTMYQHIGHSLGLRMQLFRIHVTVT